MSTPEGSVHGELAGFTYAFEPAATPGGLGAGWTLLLLHGTGGDERQLGGLGRDLLPGAAHLAPRGNVLEGGAPRFFARLGLGRFDPTEVQRGADALATFVREAADAHGLDRARTIAVGYSNGANAALAAMQRDPGLIRGAVLLRAMLVLDPPDGTPLDGTDLLALGGEFDPLLDRAGFDRLVAVTRAAGANVIEHVEPGAGHDLASGDLVVAGDWLRSLTSG